MIKISIIHFAPIEYYPPIQNLLNELLKAEGTIKIKVFSTYPVQTSLHPFSLKSDHIKLVRLGYSGTNLRPLLRYLNYGFFFCSVLFFFVWHRPKRIMYFETISSWPAIMYKRFLNTNCEIMIHYHEYTSEQEYREGMTLTRHFHQLERWLYPRASWVSHTNEFRMKRFTEDISPVTIQSAQIVPNYPPMKWHVKNKKVSSVPLKVVYVGAFSLETMYVQNFANWIIQQNGKVIWDIYSYNFTLEAQKFINGLRTPWIVLKHGVDYYALPKTLKEYSVGVILYNGHIPNYVLNAPNKLFEYLACGLDVWFPLQMAGSSEFINETGFPKVLAIDFTDLVNFDFSTALKRDGEENKRIFYCEDALLPLINKLTSP